MSVATPHLATYAQLREISRQLHKTAMKFLDKHSMLEAARRLGLLRDNVVVMQSETESAVLQEFCLYEVRRGGLNAIERYWQDRRPPEGSMEATVLKAMQRARYCVVIVESMEPGTGIHTRDVISDERLFLTDVGLSQSVEAGLILATRLVTVGEITMTTGASLPVALIPADERESTVQRFKSTAPNKLDAESVIQACLETGSGSHIEFANAEHLQEACDRASAHRSQVLHSSSARRNDPCPCGSGKKYKACCLRR